MMAAWFGVYDDDFGGPTSPGSPVAPCASDPYVDAVDLGDQVGQRFFGEPFFIPYFFTFSIYDLPKTEYGAGAFPATN